MSDELSTKTVLVPWLLALFLVYLLEKQLSDLNNPTTSLVFPDLWKDSHEKDEFKSPIQNSKTELEPTAASDVKLTQNPAQSTILKSTTLKSTILKSTIPKHLAKKQNTCESVLHTGAWHNLELFGFERTVNSTTNHAVQEIISNPRDPRYLLVPWPPYKFWTEQNYTGTWKTSGCDLMPDFSKNQLSTCFENGKRHVHFVGDSRTRQLYRSFSMILENNTIFIDRQGVKEDTRIIDGITTVSYTYSQCFFCSQMKSYVLDSIKDRLKKIRLHNLATGHDPKERTKLVVVIGDQVLHPAKARFEDNKQKMWESKSWADQQMNYRVVLQRYQFFD